MSGEEPQMSGTQPSTESRPPEQPQDAVELNDMSSRTDAKAAAEAETGPSLPAKDEQPSLSSNRAGETEAKPDSTGSAAAAAAAAAEAKGKAKEDSSAVQTDRRRDGDDLSIEPTSPHKSSTDSPICTITLLLPTGARHPYKIDEKYLSKRGVEIPDETPTGQKDPFSISVYKLKELILREWREEWEARPASPTSIRLIHFGKLLEDKESLKKYNFSADTPNVVHMSVRPAEMVEEDEAGKSKSGGRETRSQRGGGCCVIL